MNGETVIRRRAGTTTDRYDNEIPDWSNATELEITGALVAPTNTREDNDDRSAVITQTVVYLPPGADLLPSDHLVVRGVEHEIDGDPGDWQHPHVGPMGIEVPLRKVSG